MKTKNDVILEVLNAQVLMLVQKDLETKKGYGDRFMKAAHIVLAGGVKAIGGGKYEVKSGTQADVTYTVNGSCDCEDAKNWTRKQKGEVVRSFAPEGRCKHRLAVTFEKIKDTRLKDLVDKRYPHPHTWDCDTHRGEGVTCWQMQCPDPTKLPCPVCSARAPAPPDSEEHVDITTGEITTETPFPEEYPTMMSTISETIKAVIEDVTHHTNGHTTEPETAAVATQPPDVAELPPLVTAKTPELPEAPVSMCLTLRLPENHQLTYTLRGVTDAEVLDRLPGVLARLEKIMHTEVDYELNFIQRLVRAFVPKKVTYQGK